MTKQILNLTITNLWANSADDKFMIILHQIDFNSLCKLSPNKQFTWDVKVGFHNENKPIQIYWKFYHQKHENFQIKNSDIFVISAQNIGCGYSLEPPRRGGSNECPQSMFWARGGSNEYPQSMFCAEIRNIMYTPVNPSFYYIKVGFKGVKII